MYGENCNDGLHEGKLRTMLGFGNDNAASSNASGVNRRSPTELDDPLFEQSYLSVPENTDLSKYQEYVEHGRHGADFIQQYDDESPFNSIDYDQQSDWYGTTPPNYRERRRLKEKVRGFASRAKMNQVQDLLSHEELESKKRVNRRRIPLRADVGSEANDSDGGLLDAMLTREVSRRRREHVNTSSENQYRKVSHSFSEINSSQDSVDSDSITNISGAINVDTRNRFKCLNTKPVMREENNANSSRSFSFTATKLAHPSGAPSTLMIDCPQDRYDFFRTFSAVIKLGSSASARKEKEAKLCVGGSPLFLNQFGRQISSEQELWNTRISDLIWLELQAYLNLRSNKDQDEWLCKERSTVCADFETVMNFKANMMYIIKTSCGSDAAVCCCRTSSGGSCMKHVLLQQCSVLEQTADLLLIVEKAESLFPTQKALVDQCPIYGSIEFQRRMATLCLWLTITRDIAHKLRLMAHILQIDTCRLGSAKEWICVDLKLLDALNSQDGRTESDGENLNEQEYLDQEEGDILQQYNANGDSDDSALESGVILPRKLSRRKSVRFEDDSGEDVKQASTDLPAVFEDQKALLAKVSKEKSIQSIYRLFIDAALKKNGLRKIRLRLKDLLDGTLQRARYALIKPNSVDALSSHESVTLDGRPPRQLTMDQANNKALLLDHGAWSAEFMDMSLPSFRPTYLFLVRIPLNILHECLKLRLEQRPENDPSLLSLKQLIYECKEVLSAAVTVKQYYLQMVCSVLSHKEEFDLDMTAYEEDLMKMLEVYFEYIQMWMSGLQQLPEMSKRLKNFLVEEWNFTKCVSPHVRGGEANAGNRFCLMASSLLRSTSDFLETGIDECLNQLYDTTSVDSVELSPECLSADKTPIARKNSKSIQLRSAIIQTCRHFKDHFHEARERSSKALGFAKMLRKDLEIAAEFHVAVDVPELYKALQQGHHVRVVLEHQMKYMVFIPDTIASNPEHILQLLNVICGHDELSITSDTVMQASDNVELGYLLLVNNETNVGEDCEYSDCERSVWLGAEVKVDITVETAIALSHTKVPVEGLLLVVSSSVPLADQRRKFERQMGSAVELVNEQISCHQAIADSIVELKNAATDLREKVAYAISQVDEKLHIDDLCEMDEQEKNNVLTLFRETLHQCYNFGFEYHREVTRLVSGGARTKLHTALVDFANSWMMFVTKKCERGRGLRPRWANQGLEFLLVACDPRVLATLTDQQFTELKKSINDCVTHVIGDKVSGGLQTPPSRSSPDLLQQKRLKRIQSMPEPKRYFNRKPILDGGSAPTTPFPQMNTTVLKDHRVSSCSPLISLDPVDDVSDDQPITFEAHNQLDARFFWYCPSARDESCGGFLPRTPHFGNDVGVKTSVITQVKSHPDSLRDSELSPRERRQLSMLQRICDDEQKRNDDLVTSKVIGRVTCKRTDVDYHTNLRRVNFKWQRGIKIGEGTFGKVYTAINMDSGTYMAMKEIPIRDHQTFKSLADEIKIFEGISHPNLVHYYGVEIYRDEMIIFMEYCSHGTIEEAARQGLTEDMIRRYTKDILVAIDVLHEHHIIHRDIKGANIFLTANGSIKLGDFGCSVKLKADTTMPGELKSHIDGTPAFMAPEVFTSPEKAGRAADIWSLGCVVIEMATGRRPWFEFEHKWQIMFKVGMGNLPRIPDSLSEEGKDFLNHCIVLDAMNRWAAWQLKDHPFVKVYSEEDGET